MSRPTGSRCSDGFPRFALPGQFNMLGYPGIGEAPISFSGHFENGEIEHTIRAVGMATRFMEHLQKGSEVLVRGPYGRGWPMEPRHGEGPRSDRRRRRACAARPVIQEVMKNRADFGKVTSCIGSRNEQGLMFTDEYRGLAEDDDGQDHRGRSW